MKFVNCHGNVWKLTDENFLIMLRDIAGECQGGMDSYGKLLGPLVDVSRLHRLEAQDMVDWAEAHKQEGSHNECT